MQLKNHLERERSNDTATDSSNVTVIECHHVENEEINVVVNDEVCDKKNHVEFKTESDIKMCAKFQLADNENDNEMNNPINFSSSNGGLPSCLLRRDSSRASVKKKVRCSETAEIIPASDYFINITEGTSNVAEDDEDDVFSDSAPAQLARGNMCTPYVPRKGSLPISEALPDWFPNPRLFLFTLALNSIFSSQHVYFKSYFPSCLPSTIVTVFIQ